MKEVSDYIHYLEGEIRHCKNLRTKLDLVERLQQAKEYYVKLTNKRHSLTGIPAGFNPIQTTEVKLKSKDEREFPDLVRFILWGLCVSVLMVVSFMIAGSWVG